MADIKDVFDSFEADDFIAAKDQLSQMLSKMTNDYVKTTLSLEADPIPQETENEPEGD